MWPRVDFGLESAPLGPVYFLGLVFVVVFNDRHAVSKMYLDRKIYSINKVHIAII